MTKQLITLDEAAEISGWSLPQLLRKGAEGEIAFHYRFSLVNTELGELSIAPSDSNPIPWSNHDKHQFATPLPLEAERHISEESFSAAYGPGHDELITLKLLPSMIQAVLTNDPVFITYGWLHDGTVFKVINPERGLLISKKGLLISTSFQRTSRAMAMRDKGDWYYRCPDEWLRKREWSVLSAMLLFTGLNPRHSSSPTWDEFEKRWKLSSMERLGQRYEGSNYSLLSRKELQKQLIGIRKEAEKRREVIIQESGQLYSVKESRDNEAYESCQKFLRFYDESEKKLNIFIERWQESKGLLFDEFDQPVRREIVPVTFFLQWAANNDLTRHIPWWDEAVQDGFIDKKALETVPLSVSQGTPAGSGQKTDQRAKKEHCCLQPTHPEFAYSNDVQLIEGKQATPPEPSERPKEQPKLLVEADDCYISGAELITDKTMGDFLNIKGAPRPSWKQLKRWIKLVRLNSGQIVFMPGGPNKEFSLHRDALPSLKNKYFEYYEKQKMSKKSN